MTGNVTVVARLLIFGNAVQVSERFVLQYFVRISIWQFHLLSYLQEILRYVSHSAWFVNTARLPSSILKPKISQLDSRPMNAVCRATVARTQSSIKFTYANLIFIYSVKNNFAKERNKISTCSNRNMTYSCARRAQRYVRYIRTYGNV